MNDLKSNEMIFYCFLHPILTIVFFLIWISTSTLPGGVIGMTPFLIGFVLLITLGIELTLLLIFRKKLVSYKSKIGSLIFAFIIYELTVWLFSNTNKFAILESFKKTYTENIEGAFSFSSILSLFIIFGLILISESKKYKQ